MLVILVLDWFSNYPFEERSGNRQPYNKNVPQSSAVKPEVTVAKGAFQKTTE